MDKIPEISVCLAQIRVTPGQPRTNTHRMLKAISTATRRGAEMIVFPELAIPGYMIGDAWEQNAFLRECEEYGNAILAASENILIVFGNVAVDRSRTNEDGRPRKYNALFVAEDGKFLKPDNSPYNFLTKTLMSNYNGFDESRYFYDTRKLAAELKTDTESLTGPIRSKKLVLGCSICEDRWDDDYTAIPMQTLANKGTDLLVNISSSPFVLSKREKRANHLAKWAKQLGKPVLYVNNTGAQNNGKTIWTFDGGTNIYTPSGKILTGTNFFEESLYFVDLPSDLSDSCTLESLPHIDVVEQTHTAILYGTRRFMKECGISKITVGISGGIDSAVNAAVYSELLPAENLLLVNMPSKHSSIRTIKLARELAKNIGCFYAEHPIDSGVNMTYSQVDGMKITNGKHVTQHLKLTDLIRENIQARDRSSRLLAAISAAFGGAFVCNTNKVEMTIGYSTMHGDLGGFLANLGDLWKSEIYSLGRYINSINGGVGSLIPLGSFSVRPSAELSPAQNIEEDKGDPFIYPYHERLFATWVERLNRVTPEEILEWHMKGELEKQIGFNGNVIELFPNRRDFIADLERWWAMFQGIAVAKRIQAPPILAIKSRAFGHDLREAQMRVWFSEKYQSCKKEFLA